MSYKIKSLNLANSTFLFQSFKNICLFLSFSVFGFLLVFNFSFSIFADFEPIGPTPPTFPTPSGLQENDNSSTQSSKSSSNFSQSLVSQNSSNSSSFVNSNSQISNSNISSVSVFSSSFSSIFQSNQVLVSSSTSSKIAIPEIAQDGTVRTGGFSSFFFVFVIIGGIFGFRYWQIKNRTLKTVEKKIK